MLIFTESNYYLLMCLLNPICLSVSGLNLSMVYIYLYINKIQNRDYDLPGCGGTSSV